MCVGGGGGGVVLFEGVLYHPPEGSLSSMFQATAGP